MAAQALPRAPPPITPWAPSRAPGHPPASRPSLGTQLCSVTVCSRRTGQCWVRSHRVHSTLLSASCLPHAGPREEPGCPPLRATSAPEVLRGAARTRARALGSSTAHPGGDTREPTPWLTVPEGASRGQLLIKLNTHVPRDPGRRENTTETKTCSHVFSSFTRPRLTRHDRRPSAGDRLVPQPWALPTRDDCRSDADAGRREQRL